MLTITPKNGKGTNAYNNKNVVVLNLSSIRSFFLQALIAIFTGVFAYNLRNLINPTKRGFFCGDLSIRYPYYPSTIHSLVVLFVGNFALFIASIFTEHFYHANPNGGRDEKCMLIGHTINYSWVRIIKFVSIFELGFIINHLLTNVIKVSLGSLRPNFIDTCQPTFTYLNEVTTVENCPSHVYIENYTCTNSKHSEIDLLDAHLSFFSGHSSTSFYFATFLILYFHIRVGRFEKTLTPVLLILYTVLVSLSGIVVVSRIYDNKHHPIDTIFGSLVGMLISCTVVYLYKEDFIKRSASDFLVNSDEHELPNLDPKEIRNSL